MVNSQGTNASQCTRSGLGKGDFLEFFNKMDKDFLDLKIKAHYFDNSFKTKYQTPIQTFYKMADFNGVIFDEEENKFKGQF